MKYAVLSSFHIPLVFYSLICIKYLNHLSLPLLPVVSPRKLSVRHNALFSQATENLIRTLNTSHFCVVDCQQSLRLCVCFCVVIVFHNHYNAKYVYLTVFTHHLLSCLVSVCIEYYARGIDHKNRPNRDSRTSHDRMQCT